MPNIAKWDSLEAVGKTAEDMVDSFTIKKEIYLHDLYPCIKLSEDGLLE